MVFLRVHEGFQSQPSPEIGDEAYYRPLQSFQTNNKSNNLCGGSTYRVSLSERECDCVQWKLNGIPSSHAIEVCRQYGVDPTIFVPECYSTTEYALTYSLSFFAPLADIEYWDKPNFQLRHNPDRRIRHRGRDVTTRIHNEMDWAQTRARQQYQAQDRARPSTGGSASRH
ncbi:hypothetical protein ACS0TY_014565 [Phlomoides rotata]